MKKFLLFILLMVSYTVYGQVKPQQLDPCEDANGDPIPGCLVVSDTDGEYNEVYVGSLTCSEDTLFVSYNRWLDDVAIYVDTILNAGPCLSDSLELGTVNDSTYLFLLDMNGNTVDSVNLCTITCPPIPVTAYDDDITVSLCEPYAGNVSVDNGNGADELCDTDASVFNVDPLTATDNGWVALASNGDFVFYFSTYDAMGGTTTGTFTYYIECVDGTKSYADVVVTIDPDDTGVAADDNYSMDANSVLSEDAASNDTTCSVEATTYSADTLPTNGTLIFNSDGTFIYVPDQGYDGSDSFTYEILCGGCVIDTATVDITVNP